MTAMMFEIPYIEADGKEFVLVVESQTQTGAASSAILDSIELSLQNCPTGMQGNHWVIF
jgi:hypothetical protein